MSLYRLNLVVANNEDLSHNFQLTNEAGNPLNLSEAEIAFGVAMRPGDQKILGDALEIVDAPAGMIEIFVAADTLGTLIPTTYLHDLVLTVEGTAVRIWEGTLEIKQGVA